MSSRRKMAAFAAGAVVAALAAGTLVRPDHTNPPTDPAHTLRSRTGNTSALADVVDRACGDCHSNATEWRWYTRVAPLSWIMASAVRKGRDAVNFSEWATYSPATRRALLEQSCRDARTGTMPVRAYLTFRPDAKLSARDVETICTTSQKEVDDANDERSRF